jgi:chemotaxis protein MotB
MARKKKHEEHVNAEAWAIPYGDLVTLLFALFTVMYAVSSVNEGKFRVLSDSLIAAFHGAPKSIQPINVGQKQAGKGGDKELVGVTPTALMKIKSRASESIGVFETSSTPAGRGAGDQSNLGALARIERQVEEAMKSLIDAKMVNVRRENMWLEIEINTDILFPSGQGDFTPAAEPVLDKLAEVLKPFTNRIRVEGHTDDRPIRTAAFPSNWELSAARAASVVHQFMREGIEPQRLEIVGFGEFHPRQPNDTAEGRNANRRVAILVLEDLTAGGASPATALESTRGGPAGGAQSAAAPPGAATGESAAPPGAIDETLLVKSRSRGYAAPPKPLGPVELVWPGSEAPAAKAPAAAAHHE